MSLLDRFPIPRAFWRSPKSVEPKSENPPKLSCFVRGLIKSMKESPKKWFIGSGVSPYDHDIWIYQVCGWLYINGNCPSLTLTERFALKKAVKQLRRQRIKSDPSVRFFERLGCPDNSSNP